MEREKLGSRLGFILLSAGCAIGIGNVWKFPYMVGKYGGSAFVLVYLLCLLLIGVPMLVVEFSLGRASQKSPAKLYDELAPKGSKWRIHSYACVVGNYLLMMFYTAISGLMLYYFYGMATGKFAGLDTAGISEFYKQTVSNPVIMIVCTFIVIILGFVVCAIGLKNGVERITKYMMLALLALMVILAINSIFLDGGKDGLIFYLVPNFNTMVDIGVTNVIVGAMNQAFFTLSLGIGSMAIFGSYLKKERSLLGEAINVSVLDTFVAFTSGLIIFPACFAYGVEPNAGPPLIFETLPNIFVNLPLGRLWGSLFFVFLSFAALSTVFAVFENIIACTMDLFGWSRKKACIINGVALLVLSLPAVLGYNLLSFIQPLGAGSSITDLEDAIVSQYLLPLGSLCFLLFCVTRYGWGWKNFIKEANTGKGLKFPNVLRGYMTFVLPILILIIFIAGVIK